MDRNKIYCGNSLDVLKTFPDKVFQCCITSPPFFGLRSYNTGKWIGGSQDCVHDTIPARNGRGGSGPNAKNTTNSYPSEFPSPTCSKCGAIYEDFQLGLETTPDEYVAHLVEVFREVRRTLRDDGILFLNLGDSYAGSWGNSGHRPELDNSPSHQREKNTDYISRKGWDNRRDRPASSYKLPNIKPKDLIGIPWKLAEALKEPYYGGIIKNELDRVWLAATIDAEGTICGFTHIRSDDGTTRTGVHVSITNTDTKMLKNAKRTWPASINGHEIKPGGRLGTRPLYRWTPSDINKKSLLMRELYPYLIVKKKQCRLAYNLFEISKTAKRNIPRSESDETHSRRLWIMQALSDLNHNRKVEIPTWCIEPPTVLEPGFYLRSTIIWEKPNCMPSSTLDRPTTSHEYIFLFAKEKKYYYDYFAIQEESTSGDLSKRNKRTVWTIPTKPFKGGSHFAVFPEDLVIPPIKSSTSEKGCCPACNAPYKRILLKKPMVIRKTDRMAQMGEFGRTQASGTMLSPAESKTVGWQQTCSCILDCAWGDPEHCLVLDPFMGSGTVGVVSKKLGRNFVGIDLNGSYVNMAVERINSVILF